MGLRLKINLIFSAWTTEESIMPVSSKEVFKDGDPVTMSCTYEGSITTDSLLWYRQYPRSKPEFLYLRNEADFKQEASPPVPGLSVHLSEEKNRVFLNISSAALSDSALFISSLLWTDRKKKRNLQTSVMYGVKM
uniref:Si:ch211-106g8.54 n=1 Tax=Denticeps clupeoides TaxID=299321 RepID=A0AAY4ACA8_9TELE